MTTDVKSGTVYGCPGISEVVSTRRCSRTYEIPNSMRAHVREPESPAHARQEDASLNTMDCKADSLDMEIQGRVRAWRKTSQENEITFPDLCDQTEVRADISELALPRSGGRK